MFVLQSIVTKTWRTLDLRSKHSHGFFRCSRKALSVSCFQRQMKVGIVGLSGPFAQSNPANQSSRIESFELPEVIALFQTSQS